MFATAAGELTAPGAPFATMRARGWRCGKVSESVIARSVAKLGDWGMALADERNGLCHAVEQAVAADDPAAGTLV
jgi:hypothetical protein